MIRKTLSLFLCAVMLLGVMCGCDRTPNKKDEYKSLDTDKAAEVALEYMNNKYDKEFQVVSSEKDASHSIVPGVIQDCWCDVEFKIKDSESDETYTVRVANTENEEEYTIKWDNYMTTIATNLVEREINSIISEMKLSDYFIYLWDIGEKGVGGTVGNKGFKPNFHIDIENDTLSSVMEKNEMWVCFNLYLPESDYNKSLVSDFEKTLKSVMSHENLDDYVSVSVLFFDDDYYSEIKKINENGSELPLNHEYKAIHEDVIKLN